MQSLQLQFSKVRKNLQGEMVSRQMVSGQRRVPHFPQRSMSIRSLQEKIRSIMNELTNSCTAVISRRIPKQTRACYFKLELYHSIQVNKDLGFSLSPVEDKAIPRLSDLCFVFPATRGATSGGREAQYNVFGRRVLSVIVKRRREICKAAPGLVHGD